MAFKNNGDSENGEQLLNVVNCFDSADDSNDELKFSLHDYRSDKKTNESGNADVDFSREKELLENELQNWHQLERNKPTSASNCRVLQQMRKSSAPPTFVSLSSSIQQQQPVNFFVHSNKIGEVQFYSKNDETKFSCHLQEVEMILERISSNNNNARLGQKTSLPTLNLNPQRKLSSPSRWRDYFSSLGEGVSSRLGRKESLSTNANAAKSARGKMSSASECGNEKFVTRSQSMRLNGQQTRPSLVLVANKLGMFVDEGNDQGCSTSSNLGRGGTRVNGVSSSSPARSWKSGSSKMESNSTEFRRRTTSVPNRRDRRSQSMRVPGNNGDRRPYKVASNRFDSGEEDGDFERMRTFTIDPSKPGVIINRGDSFRRRCNTEKSLKAKPQYENAIDATNGFLPHPPDLEIESNLGQSRNRKSLSPMTPGNADTFVTPPESMSPLVNAQTTPGVRKYDILVFGLEGVGKTAMINQFMTSEYCNPFQTDADESVPWDNTVSVQLDGEESRLTFFEIDNQKNDAWSTMNGHAYLVVYSIDDAPSFRNAKKLVNQLRLRACSADKPIILVANKIDLERKRQVTADDGRSLAKDQECKFVEITVALGHHVDELLVGVLAQARQYEAASRAINATPNDEEVFTNEDPLLSPHCCRPISKSLTNRPAPRSESTTESGFRFSPHRQQSQNQILRRSSTKRRKRLSTSRTPEDSSSISPPTSCSNLTAVGQRFVQKMFGRRRSSRSLEDLLTLA